MSASDRNLMLELATIYLTKRQLQGRPTTLRRLGKRMGISASQVLDGLESKGLRYVLLAHEELGGRKKRGTTNTEVLLSHVPEAYAKSISLDAQAVEESFREVFRSDPEPVDDYVEAQEAGQVIADTLDPFAPYRITPDKYEVLKEFLITFEELVQVAREQGYAVSAIRRACGGDRMREPLPSFFWRPYVLGKKRFYLKDVVDHLVESDKTYASRGKLNRVRMQRYGDPEVNKFIQFSRPRKTRPRKAKVTNT